MSELIEYIARLGELEQQLYKLLDPSKEGYEENIKHYILAKKEIIEMYKDQGMAKVYDELIKYVKEYIDLLRIKTYKW